jgi:CRP-like cAMP-binding protein
LTLSNLNARDEEKSEDAEVKKVLSESPLFSELDPEKITAIIKMGEKRRFPSNEFIVQEGELAKNFFLILEGQVEVRLGSKAISKMGRGQFFGEATLSQDETRTADILATRPTKCFVLSKESLKELIAKDPQIAAKLLQEIIKRNKDIKLERREQPQVELESSFDFESESAGELFRSLVDSFIDDYMVKKYVSEKSGWRTVTEISRESGIPLSLLYGRQGGGTGTALEEPLRRGLVEKRFFPGERGRGGEVMRLRIAYEREPVRPYVNERIKAGRKKKDSES